MADASYVVSRVIRKVSDFLIRESAATLLLDVKSKFEGIQRELRYMQEFIQHHDRSSPIELELEEDIRVVALDAEEVIDNFFRHQVQKRKKGVPYLLETFDIGVDLEQIEKTITEISEKIVNYDRKHIAVTVETPGVGVGTSSTVTSTTIVSPALKELDYILTQNLITSDEVIEMVEHVKDDDLGDTQNIVSSLTSTWELSQREIVWMEDIRDICNYAKDVAVDFIDRRQERLRMGVLGQVLYLFQQYYSEREFKKKMEYIRKRLEDALYRRWTFGDGGKDRGDKKGSRTRSAPASMSLVQPILAKVPFFFFTGAFLPLLFVLLISLMCCLQKGSIQHATFFWILFFDFMVFVFFYVLAPELMVFIQFGSIIWTVIAWVMSLPRSIDKNLMCCSIQHATFFWILFFDFMVFVFFYVLPPGLMVFIQFGSIIWTVIAWVMSLPRSIDKNLKTIERYLALMGALFSDIESEQGLALNRRQQVWVDQLKLVARKSRSLLASYPKPENGWCIVFLINKILLAQYINDLLNEIFDISDRKNIYGLANIQGRRKIELVSTEQASESENSPHSSSSYPGLTDVEWKFQLIKGEKEMMDALFYDAQQIGELEGRSKIWVEQMQGIARETEDIILELQHMPRLIWTFRCLVGSDITAKINGVKNKIEDASRRRIAYGLVQLQSQAESLSTVQILGPRAQQSLIIRESGIVGFDEDVEVLTTHLLADEKARCITSIVGIEGTGKTTLARLVYENKSVIAGFDRQVWVSMSSTCTVQELLVNIANQDKNKTTTTSALETLASKKHLIVVDGIETLHVLNTLRETIPDSSTASRFLLTTRNPNLAQKAGPRSFLYPLQLLDDQNSWILFSRNLRVDLPLELESYLTKIGEKIVAKCGGLPSEILKLSNLLSCTDVTKENWSFVLEHPNQGQNPWSQTLNTISNLPSYLKRCLFYFELFPANFVIPARRLVVLWVAEGLVQHGEDQEPPEQVAERYLTELIHLNFVQIAKRKPNGKVKTCRLPKAVHEYLVTRANRSRIRRVADRLNWKDIWHKHIHDNAATHSASLEIYKDVLSFLSFDAREGSQPGQDIGNFLNLCISSNCLLQLRVLDLEGVFKPELLQNIARLSRLRYLGLRRTYLQSLPSSISNLLKLQTLDLEHTCIHTLTSSIWNMELRHLFLSETYRTRFPLKPKGTGNSLSNLQTLLGLFIDEETPVKGGLDELVNIRKLGIACQSMSLQQETMQSQLDAVADWIVKLDYLQSLRLKSRDEQGQPWTLYLNSLKHLINLTDMYLLGRLDNPSILSEFPPSLVELTLSHSKLEVDPMQFLKDLPNLRSLSLLAECYMGKILVCESQGFPQLYVLKVWNLEQLEEWKIEQEAFPSLKQLEIRSCPLMNMLPDGLKHVHSLVELKLTNMRVENDIVKNNIPLNCQVYRD